ncbi:oligosaccharide repeat unit polymerase [Morganella morganii]|uniref:oligosaccharide repeat unit polymerase n=1 Tax=Morganella morganii TaxID=582 RepID=UPI0028647C6C|nr:oligosaccharide repeat unit polymerase [Morganella morganii]MDR5688076.1 oligosaccharide repeat unit polymerase [Morganella morganii]
MFKNISPEIKKTILLIFTIQFLSNTISYIIFLNNGYYYLEREYYKIDIENSIYSYIAFLIFFVLVSFSFFLTQRNIRPVEINEKVYSQLILFLQVSYFFLNLHYETNIAGHPGRKDMPAVISFFFVIFNPDILFLIYLFFTKESKLKKLNIIVYLLSMSIRGWMAGIFYVVLYYVITKKYKLRTYFTVLLIIIFLILSLPFIINAKWYLRSSGTESFINAVFNISDYKNSLMNALEYLIFRFQHISSVIFITDHLQSINHEIIKPYWAEGNIQLFFEKIFNINLQNFNNYVVTDLMGIKGATWNIHVGIESWFIMNPFDLFLYLYIFLSILFTNSLSIVRHSKAMQSFILYMIFSRLFVGWNAAYINLIISLLVTILIFFIIKKIQINRL